jgi:hypothetical protein
VADPNAITLDEDAAPYDFVLTGSDTEGDALSFTITAQPQKGALACNNEACTYTPNANANGDDTFNFVANDGALDSLEATVTITLTPINDAPAATEQAVTTPQDTDLVVVLGGTDVEGDALSFTITTQPTHGQLVCNNEACTYSPDAGFVGQDQFMFTANDGAADSEPARVLVNVGVSDDDGDGIFNNDDNCPLVENTDQLNTDTDALGDACDDDDDNDSVLDADDDCPEAANPEQKDTDGDGQGDACDDDDDDDGLEEPDDNCPFVPNPDQADLDEDGVGDACDDDKDDDGVHDLEDLCPAEPDPDQGDADGDGLGDSCDHDVPAESEDPDLDLQGGAGGVGGEAGSAQAAGQGGQKLNTSTLVSADEAESEGGCAVTSSRASSGAKVLPGLLLALGLLLRRLRG